MGNGKSALIVWLIHFFVWHVFAGIFALFDHKKWLRRYKIVFDSRVSYLAVLPRVLFNQIFIMLPIMLLIGGFCLGFGDNPAPWWGLFLHAYALGLIHDVVFYFGHRLLHTRIGFTKFGHYLHHQSRGGTAAASMYMSSFDFVIEIIAIGVMLRSLKESLLWDGVIVWPGHISGDRF